MKNNANTNDPNGKYSKGWNARRSLNLLKFSLSRPMTLPHVEDDSDEEMEIVEQDERFAMQFNGIDKISVDGKQPDKVGKSSQLVELDSPDTDVNMEEALVPDDNQDTSCNLEQHDIVVANCPNSHAEDNNECDKGNETALSNQNYGDILASSLKSLPNGEPSSKQMEESSSKPFSLDSEAETSLHSSPSCLGDSVVSTDVNIVPCSISPVLKSPTPSVSPRVNNTSRKSLRTSSTLTASQKELELEEAPGLSLAKPSNSIYLNLSSKRSQNCFKPTEHLAASLQRGLEILDAHRQSTSLRKSSFRFSCKPADLKALLPLTKVDIGVQTHFPLEESLEGSTLFLCSKCKTSNFREEHKDVSDGSNLQLVTVDAADSCDKFKAQVPKVCGTVMLSVC